MAGIEIALGVLVLFVLLVGFKSIRLVPKARVVIVQRLGRSGRRGTPSRMWGTFVSTHTFRASVRIGAGNGWQW